MYTFVVKVAMSLIKVQGLVLVQLKTRPTLLFRGRGCAFAEPAYLDELAVNDIVLVIFGIGRELAEVVIKPKSRPIPLRRRVGEYFYVFHVSPPLS